MERAGFFTIPFWITTFLVISILAKISPESQSSQLSITTNFVSLKRQISTEETIGAILHRMNNLEAEFVQSKSAVERLQGYFKTLGFQENVSNKNHPRAQPPCASGLVSLQEMDWTPFGSSSCVKLVSGLFTFVNATGICEQQYRIGKDLANPVVVSVDSSEKARDLLHILRGQRELSHVWADRKDTPPAATVGLNCSQLRIAGGNETEVEWRTVECGRLSGVVCEKPMIVSYVEVVRKQLEGNKRAEGTDAELEKAQAEIRQLGKDLAEERRLREGIKSLLDNFRLELTEKIARVESKSATNEAELRRMGDQVGQLRSSDEESSKHVGVWELGGPSGFDLPKAMGVWYRIEGFKQSSKFTTNRNCEKYNLSLKRYNRIDYIYNYRLVSVKEMYTSTYNYRVVKQSPHLWKGTEHTIWQKTDYESWAIRLICSNHLINSCYHLHILSRTRTLPLSTWEMLRDTAEKNGFLKANGGLINQTSC